MSNNTPAKQYCMTQLDVSSGHAERVVSSNASSLYEYFRAIAILNQQAHRYGLVYLACERALEELLHTELKAAGKEIL